MAGYKGRLFNREQIYSCGEYLDGSIYPVFQRPGVRRKRSKPTSEVQAKLNQTNAEKKLTRLVHTNFTPEDIALHLTYRNEEEPADEEEARRNLSNYLKRVRRLFKKLGIAMKYINCTEYGKTTGRCHHHLIISGGIDRDVLEQTWGKGYANSKRLQFGDDGVTGLTRYMVKDRRFYRRWNQSRNLIIPEPVEKDGSYSMEDIADIQDAVESRNAYNYFEARYPGYELVDVGYTKNEVNRCIYIRFEMRRKQGRRD